MKVKEDVDNLKQKEIKRLYWEERHNIDEVAKKLDISFWRLYRYMRKNDILRRDRSEASYVASEIKPQFNIKSKLSIVEEKLKVAGIMLYWAEGTLKGNTVDFANSNPEMIKIFLRFLREICGVEEERLRIYLYAYVYQDIESLKLYWHSITKVSLKQFTKPYIREGNPNLSQRKLLYGLIHVRYNDKRLLKLIESWIVEYVTWAGTQAANGDRL